MTNDCNLNDGGALPGQPPHENSGVSVSRDGARAVAKSLAAMGFRTIPVKPCAKAPVGSAWQQRDTSPESINDRFSQAIGADAQNVGILLSSMLDGRQIVDVDLDHPYALELAEEFLPATPCVYGRPGAPRSHRLYIIDRSSQYHAEKLDGSLSDSGTAKTLVEYRHGEGKQSVAPGSVHPSGELVQWYDDGPPAEVAAGVLLESVVALAEVVRARVRRERGIAPESSPPPAMAARDPQAAGRRSSGDDSVADDYATRGKDHFVECLQRHGWQLSKEYTPGGIETQYWVRPGKMPVEGHSATLRRIGERWVWSVFSSSADPFASRLGGRGVVTFSLFDALATLEHGGDRGRAASELLREGFGGVNFQPAPSRSGPGRRGGSGGSDDRAAEQEMSRLKQRTLAIQARAPFPLEALPSLLGQYASELAEQCSAPVEMAALGALVAASAAIGSSAVVEAKSGWREPAILFGAVVAPSGSMKSPVLEGCLRWARAQEASAQASHKVAHREWERRRSSGDEVGGVGENGTAWPDDTPAPVPERYLAHDVTTEAVAKCLAANPRGVLLVNDELSSLFGGMDRYNRGSGVDLAFWNTAYEGRPFSRDRVGDGTTYVPYLGVCLLGCIQPSLLERLQTETHRQSGFDARWLYVAPPPWLERWTDSSIRAETMASADEIFRRLYERPVQPDELGAPQPEVITLDESARAAFKSYVNANGVAKLGESDEDFSHALGKAKGLVLRLALAIHLVRVAAGTCVSHPARIGGDVMGDAISLLAWFMDERRRLTGAMSGDVPRELLALWHWVRARPGATATDASRGMRRYRGKADEAERDLRALVSEGLLRVEHCPSTPMGGRPTDRYYPTERDGAVYESHLNTDEAEGFSSVDGGGAPEERASAA